MPRLELTEDERNELFELHDWLDQLSRASCVCGLSLAGGGLSEQQRFVDRLIAKVDAAESGGPRG